MKILTSLLIVGCAQTDTTPPPRNNDHTGTPVDYTKHDYTVRIYVADNLNNLGDNDHNGSIRTSCNIGYPTRKDNLVLGALTQPDAHLDSACPQSISLLFVVVNSGTYNLGIEITMDGRVLTAEELGLPGNVVEPGRLFPFIKGYPSGQN